MQLNDELLAEIECALAMKKKDGSPVWNDDEKVEVKISGVFAADKFIVIKKVNSAVSSQPMEEFKPQHPYAKVIYESRKDTGDVGEGQQDGRSAAGSNVDTNTTTTPEVSDTTN